MRRTLLTLALCLALLVACAPAAAGSPAGTPVPSETSGLQVIEASGTPEPSETANLCMPCGRAKETMTARIPATQTTQAMQAGQTLAAPTVRAMWSATAEAAATHTAEMACAEGDSVCVRDGHFLLQRPIGPQGMQSIARSYPYGGTEGGMREPHHGVEFVNPQGTPVLAAADGRVVFAGNDKDVTLAWVPAFYGNVVVLEHTLAGESQPVFTLYGHLFKIEVSEGQQVSAGERIGQVGATGKAIGSHLHFEVRMGNDDYKSNRNPELWLAPLPGTGVLAGRIEDGSGKAFPGRMNIQRVTNGVLDPISVAAPETYGVKELQPVQADDFWQENFVAGELPAGEYRLTLVYHATVYEQVVKIEAGRLTFVRFVVGK